MKILVFMKTHFIDSAVISEYIKLNSTKDIQSILFIDNHTNFIKTNTESPVTIIYFNNININCFLFDLSVFLESNLPYYTDNPDNKDLGKVMWYNSDYSAYIIKKYFPDYDYYWSIEFDVFCNGQYSSFFKKYNKNNSDLIMSDYRSLKDSDENWYWDNKNNWIYKDVDKYGGFFPVVRFSSKAIDFLYKKRLEHAIAFDKVKSNPENRWIFCESFVPTELSNGGFECIKLDEPHLRYQPLYNLNKERIFEKPDNRLYHPVK